MVQILTTTLLSAAYLHTNLLYAYTREYVFQPNLFWFCVVGKTFLLFINYSSTFGKTRGKILCRKTAVLNIYAFLVFSLYQQWTIVITANRLIDRIEQKVHRTACTLNEGRLKARPIPGPTSRCCCAKITRLLLEFRFSEFMLLHSLPLPVSFQNSYF